VSLGPSSPPGLLPPTAERAELLWPSLCCWWARPMARWHRRLGVQPQLGEKVVLALKPTAFAGGPAPVTHLKRVAGALTAPPCRPCAKENPGLGQLRNDHHAVERRQRFTCLAGRHGTNGGPPAQPPTRNCFGADGTWVLEGDTLGPCSLSSMTPPRPTLPRVQPAGSLIANPVRR